MKTTVFWHLYINIKIITARFPAVAKAVDSIRSGIFFN